MKIKKYFEIAKINFLNNLVYFGEFIFKALFILVILFVFINIWKVAYAGQQVIEGFSMAMMIWYLLMAEAIVTSQSSVIKEVHKEVQSGDVAHMLNKPYSYALYHLAKSISYRAISFLVTMLIGAILILLMVGGISFSWAYVIPVALIVFLALILDFAIIFLIGLFAFWIEDTNALHWIYQKMLFTVGGMLIPLEFFPDWLSKISAVMPFSYIAYYPSKLFVKFNFGEFINVALIQIVYIALFGVIIALVYRIAVRRMNINGG
jgi:ABC-2 type transport system permease protein